MFRVTHHIKRQLPIIGVSVVSLWMTYLGVQALFSPVEKTTLSREENLKSQKNSHRSFGVASRRTEYADKWASSDFVTRLSTSVSQSKQTPNQAIKTIGLVNPSDVSSSSYPSSQTGQSANKSEGASDSQVVESDAYAGAEQKVESIQNDNSAEIRDQIMSEAFRLAMQSASPSDNLISVSNAHFQAGNIETAREILLMAEKMAVDPDDEKKSSQSVSAVVKAMLRQNLNEDAYVALQNISNQHEREIAISEIAVWSARHGKVSLARNLATQIHNSLSRDVALVAIAEAEASYEGAFVAMQTVGEIVNIKRKDDAYRRIALKRGSLHDFDQAEWVAQLVKNVSIKNSTIVSLAKTRAKLGDCEGGLHTLQNVNDPVVTDIALRDVSEDLARGGLFSRSAYVMTRIRDEKEKSYALEVLSVEMARSGDLSASLANTSLIPDKSIRERALRSVSGVTAHQGEPKRARNVAIRIDSPKERAIAYRSIAQASSHVGDFSSAYNILQDIEIPGEKALALVDIARTRQKQGNPQKALTMLEEARQIAQKMTSAAFVDRIVSNMALVYAERHEWGRSLSLVKSIKNPVKRDTALKRLSHTLAEKSQIQNALESARLIHSNKIRVKAGDDIARVLARGVTPEKALQRSRKLTSMRQRIIFLLEVSKKT